MNCAQRLSASSEFTLCWKKSASKIGRVLNAFRHHRNSHYEQARGEGIAMHVLNAFRHHRNSHSVNGYSLKTLIKVLNAFRHLRNRTTDNGEQAEAAVMVDNDGRTQAE